MLKFIKPSISALGKALAAVVASAGLFTGCQNEPVSNLFSEETAVSASAGYETDTKAALLSTVPNTFTLYACSYSGSTPTGVDYIYGETMTKSDSKWVSANKFGKVASDKTVKYFAVHPLNATGLVLPSADAAGAPVFGYTLPGDAANQNDVIVASHDYSGSQENITLSFSHMLCAVDFKFAESGAFNGTVKSVSVRGVNTKGSYTLGTGWSNLSTPGTVTQTINRAVTEGMGGSSITTASNAMILIPQTAPSDATLEIAVNDGTKDVILTSPLDGQVFAAGKEYTIALDLSATSAPGSLVVLGIDVTDWVNAALGEGPEENLDAVFTVDASGKKVTFSPGNLWWDGSKFAFEAHQYDYPTSWDASHIGHFLWSPDKNVAISTATSVSGSTTDTFFAADGGAIEGYTVLSQTEWDYLFSHALAKNSSSGNTITIAGKNCIVLKPDGFSGTVADSYTAEQWAAAEASGLVALPFACKRYGNTFYNTESYDWSVYFWSAIPSSSSRAYYAEVYDLDYYTDYDDRGWGFSVRLVKLVDIVDISATYSVSNQTSVTLPSATFATGTVASIDWGDGDIEVKARPSGGEVTLSHTYASAYTGKVKINVKEGCVDFGMIAAEYFDALNVYDSEKVKKVKAFPFTVDASGKKVIFSPGNLWYDGSAFHFEEHDYDYPTKWKTSHVGHFLWSPSKDVAVSTATSLSGSTTDTLFATNGGAIEGYTVLSKDEWNYIISHALAKNSSSKNTIIIAGKNCIVLKPDGFSGTVADSYTAEQWAVAKEQYGLVALPFVSNYSDKVGMVYYGNFGHCWSGTPNGTINVYTVYFNSDDCMEDQSRRDIRFPIRLVKVL